jgi:glycosyltransferase involved in cell wall biosynthesis
MISFIIPTIWKAEEIYKSIEQFKRLQIKNVELIIVDNTHSDFYDDDPRIIIVKCSNNIFVNPAWNIGVKLAKNKYICLLNDDIYFNYVTVLNNFQKFIDQNPKLGLIGFNDKSRTKNNTDTLNNNDDELILVDTTGIVPFGYGCCIFLKKEDYFDIYEDCKIFYGDTILIVSIIDMRRKRMYYIDNLISCGRISVSSEKYPQNMNTDQIVFNKQYRNLIKGHA